MSASCERNRSHIAHLSSAAGEKVRAEEASAARDSDVAVDGQVPVAARGAPAVDDLHVDLDAVVEITAGDVEQVRLAHAEGERVAHLGRKLQFQRYGDRKQPENGLADIHADG